MQTSSEHSDFIKIEKGLNNSIIKVPTSKSHANRMLVLAAISKKPVKISNLPGSTDVQTMLVCLEMIGLKVLREGSDVTIQNSFPECEISEELINLSTGDGGTTNRFLMPLLARGKRSYQMNMAEPMRIRPMDDLVNPMKKMGVSIHKNETGYLVQGPYRKSGNYEVASEKSTQFASGLLMAVSDLSNYQIEARNIHYSEKYFLMTEELIKKFKKENKFHVPVDASSLGYAVASGLTLKSLEVPVCKEIDYHQADSAIFNILKEMNGKFDFKKGHLSVECGKLQSFAADCGDFPDLVPTLAYLASYAEGVSTLSNLEVLTHKESDRFSEIKKQLDLFGIKFEENGFELRIHGSSKECGTVKYDAPDDHRMIMTSALHMMKNNGGEISNWNHVKKSFPEFFKEFK